jgi:hypothetical protein
MSRNKAILLYSLIEGILLLAAIAGYVTDVISLKVFIVFMIVIFMLSSVVLTAIIKRRNNNK